MKGTTVFKNVLVKIFLVFATMSLLSACQTNRGFDCAPPCPAPCPAPCVNPCAAPCATPCVAPCAVVHKRMMHRGYRARMYGHPGYRSGQYRKHHRVYKKNVRSTTTTTQDADRTATDKTTEDKTTSTTND